MGTKNNPAPNDCYAKALPDEPMFVLLARDPAAPDTVRAWVKFRAQVEGNDKRLETGISVEDLRTKNAAFSELQHEALRCADAMENWRSSNDGKWRKAT